MIPVPLHVILRPTGDVRRVTRDLRSLSFRITAPGGYASATFSLDRPLILKPGELAYYTRVTIADGRHGGVIWEGRLEDPGRGAGPDGQIWEVTAVGPSAHALDRTVPLVYVDRKLSPWIKSSFNHKAGQVSISDETVASIELMFQRGVVASTAYLADVTYQDIRQAGQKLARVAFDWDTGVTDTDWRVKFLTRTDDGSSPGSVVNVASNTAGGSASGVVGDTNFNDGHNVGNLRFDRDTTSQTIGNDDTWCLFKNVSVRAMLKDASGNDITTGYTANSVLASEVVKDLLGRLLTKYDGANASVTTTSFAIEQLAWPEGVNPAGVLDELMALEPAYYWAAWEQNADGNHRFEWKAWPTTVRYEVTTKDGIDSPGSADGLFNAVTVVWQDQTGRPLKTRRTQTVAELDDAGLTREELIDLGEDGTSGKAIQAGDKFLAEHKTPPNAGTLRIARPILDRDTGRMVQPWEILPGNLIRVRGILPRVDALNVTDRDGVTVFKIVSVEYSSEDATATLELDSYSVTVARALAELLRPKPIGVSPIKSGPWRRRKLAPRR